MLCVRAKFGAQKYQQSASKKERSPEDYQDWWVGVVAISRRSGNARAWKWLTVSEDMTGDGNLFQTGIVRTKKE